MIRSKKLNIYRIFERKSKVIINTREKPWFWEIVRKYKEDKVREWEKKGNVSSCLFIKEAFPVYMSELWRVSKLPMIVLSIAYGIWNVFLVFYLGTGKDNLHYAWRSEYGIFFNISVFFGLFIGIVFFAIFVVGLLVFIIWGLREWKNSIVLKRKLKREKVSGIEQDKNKTSSLSKIIFTWLLGKAKGLCFNINIIK